MQLRFCSVAAALVLTALIPAQDLSKKIDYTTKSVTFAQAFSEISKQSGVGLFAENDLANEMIVLRLKNVTLQDAMNKIAETVGATWVKKSDGYELDRTPEMIDKLRADGLNSRAQEYEKDLTAKCKQLNIDQPLSDEQIERLATSATKDRSNNQGVQDWQQMLEFRNSLPDQRAVLKVLRLIDPKEIVSMEDGQKLVFSNKPTQMQRQVDGDFTPIAEALQKEHNAFFDACSKLKKPDTQEQDGMPFGMPEGRIQVVPDRFVLSVTRLWFDTSMQVQMITFDKQNNPMLTADYAMQPGSDMDRMMADRAKIARQNANEPEIKVSPITKQLLDFIRKTASQDGPGAQMQPVTGDLRQALLTPETVDPLSFTLSEAFLGIAELRNENLVLYPDDSMFLISMFAGMEGTFKPSLVLQAVSGFGQILPTSVNEADGWMTLAPIDRLAPAKSRMARAVLGTYLRQRETDGFTSINAAAALAASVHGFQLPTLAMFIPMVLDPQSMMGFETDISMLKIYASLSDSQISRLEDKQSIRFAELDPDQLNAISQYVFQSATPGMAPLPVEEDDAGSGAQQAARNEMTECLPNGLSPDATLSMASQTSKTYFVKTSINGGTSFTRAMELNELAYYAYQAQHAKGPQDPQIEWQPKIESIIPGEARTVTITLHLAESKALNGTLREDRKTEGGPWTLDTLPDDVKAELNKLMQRFNQMPKPDDGVNPTPPPQEAPPFSSAA